VQTGIFTDATAFIARFTCDDPVNGPPQTCYDPDVSLTDETFYSAIESCLAEAPLDGVCKEFGLYSTRYGIISDWDTKRVTNMSGVSFYDNTEHYIGFALKDAFNGDITRWDTSHVTDMSSMFYGTSMFNKPIGSWDTSRYQT
jgi:surface protein